MITKEQLDVYRDLQDKIRDFVEAYLDKFERYDYIESIEVDGPNIEVDTRTNSGCGCCSDDYDCYTIPTSYLWDPDWDIKEKEKRDKANWEALQKKMERDKKAKEEAKRKEYEHFLELKEKYNES